MILPHSIAERKIREAQEKGEFDNLPGKGKPLQLEDDSQIPEELRLAYKILKNADCLPPELELKKDIVRMEEMLRGVTEVQEKYRLMKKLNFQIMKLNMMRGVSPLLEEDQVYYDKVVEQFSKSDDEQRG
ncbi:MAG: DUF1992 domain-containing protein [Desulfobacterota bacterium]|jgi:hypothetical protein|nr:DUF1992 domain-containing protein [Thermodesulfobacteriota bacterium]